MENWFKVSADVFDSKKIKIIRSMRNGDSMALLWFFLLSVARQQNDNGYVYATEDVPYTAKTLAACGGFKPKLVETALEVFKQYKMIEIEEDGYIYIVGWSEHQSTEALAKLRNRNESDKEKNRQRVAKYRQRQKQCNDSNAECNGSNAECNAKCNDSNGSCNAECNGNCNDSNAECNGSNAECNAKCNDSNGSCNAECNGNCNDSNAECNGSNDIKNKNKNIDKEQDNNNHYSNAKCNGNGGNVMPSLVVVGKDNSHLARDDNPAGFWNKNITPITPYIADRIQAVIDEHGETITMQAVTITAQQGKNSIAYFEGVARNIASGNVQKPQKNIVKKNDVEGSVQEVIARLRARKESDSYGPTG